MSFWLKHTETDLKEPGDRQEEARRNGALFIGSYDYQRLHSGFGYVTPHDGFLGIDQGC